MVQHKLLSSVVHVKSLTHIRYWWWKTPTIGKLPFRHGTVRTCKYCIHDICGISKYIFVYINGIEAGDQHINFYPLFKSIWPNSKSMAFQSYSLIFFSFSSLTRVLQVLSLSLSAAFIKSKRKLLTRNSKSQRKTYQLLCAIGVLFSFST